MSKNHKKNHSEKITWSVVVVAAVTLAYFAVTAPRVGGTELVSDKGIHYHPDLTIIVDGVPVTIESGVGLGSVHKPIHTHDEGDGTLHLEFEGIVKKSDTRLGIFFDTWNKEWTAASFLGNPIDATHTLTMKVDGEVSTEYRELLMQDKQKIELIYQTLPQ